MLFELDTMRMLTSGATGGAVTEYSPVIQITEKSDLIPIAIVFGASGSGVTLATKWQYSEDGKYWKDGTDALDSITSGPKRVQGYSGAGLTNQTTPFWRLKHTITGSSEEANVLISTSVAVNKVA